MNEKELAEFVAGLPQQADDRELALIASGWKQAEPGWMRESDPMGWTGEVLEGLEPWEDELRSFQGKLLSDLEKRQIVAAAEYVARAISMVNEMRLAYQERKDPS